MSGRGAASRGLGYFQRLYAENPDPWDFETSPYEREKYRATLEILGERRFARGLEVGCSIGVLTQRLAARCDGLLAVDIVDQALAAARARCAAWPDVTFETRYMPRDWPAGRMFDLVVLSEVLYFLSQDDIARLASLVCESLAPGGVAVLVNYTGTIDEPCNGVEAAVVFVEESAPRLIRTRIVEQAKYRIDLLEVK